MAALRRLGKKVFELAAAEAGGTVVGRMGDRVTTSKTIAAMVSAGQPEK